MQNSIYIINLKYIFEYFFLATTKTVYYKDVRF